MEPAQLIQKALSFRFKGDETGTRNNQLPNCETEFDGNFGERSKLGVAIG